MQRLVEIICHVLSIFAYSRYRRLSYSDLSTELGRILSKHFIRQFIV